MKLRHRLSLYFTLIIVVITSILAYLSIQREARALKDELRKQGLILASTLADEAQRAFLTNHFVPLMRFIETIGDRDHLIYAMVRDLDGTVRAHSNLEEIRKRYRDRALEKAASGQIYVGISRDVNGDPLYEIAVPVEMAGKVLGVAQVGYSLASLKWSITWACVQIVFITLGGVITGVVLCYLAVSRIISPLRTLKRLAESYAKGDLDQQIEINSKDEIAELSAAFNKMAVDLKHTISELSMANRFTQSVIASISDILIIVDSNGVISMVNEAAVRLLGYSVRDISGRRIDEVVVDCHELGLKRLFGSRGSIANVERELRSKDGSLLPVLFSASVVEEAGKEGQYLVCTAKDISELKAKEREIAAEKERLLVTLRSIGDSVLVTDRDGRITMVNPKAEELTGWKQKEAMGKPITEVLDIRDHETMHPVILYPEKPAWDTVHLNGHKLVLLDRSGNKKFIIYTGAPISEGKSEMLGMVFVVRDVTERVRMEREIIKAQQLESLGLLAGGIAHDFNNILTGILGYISLAKLKCTMDDSAYKHLDSAESALFQAKDLTQQLLTFAKGGMPVKETVSISELLVKTASFALRGSNIKGEFEIAEDLWPAEVDTGQINQVINNLVINAIQAMPEGGVLRLTAENVWDPGKVTPHLKPGKYIKITVEDQGIGIPDDYLNRIFDPYFTTKREGNGLGLAIVHSIIEKHNGYIFVESEIGKGTVFTIYLPAAEQEPVSSPKQEPSGVPGPLVGARVLVMDDEKTVREVAVQMLEQIGCEAVAVEDGAALLKAYKEAMDSGRPFDAVIMDLTIPGGMGGRETIDHLLAMDPGAKAIVSSGYSNDPIVAEYKKNGFREVIPKPYRLRDLIEILKRVIGN